MAARPPDAFLSYTRFDDRRGDISAFREHLQDAVREVTGEPFEIFQDVEGIGIGEHWSDKLDQMLDEARFFIPIVTPSYFRSKPCRDELEKFLRAEGARQREDLVLPIYYIESEILEDSDLREADLLAVAIHRRQRQDWRKLRFSSFNTKTVKTALHRLGIEIIRARRGAMRVAPAPQSNAEVGVAAAHPETELPGARWPWAEAEETQEHKKFDVILATAGKTWINVIREVRAITALGLKEAKDLVEGAPQPVSMGVSKEKAEKIKKQLEGVGATVQVEEQQFDVILATVGDRKINVVKEVRALTGLGLKEAVDLVGGAPQPVSKGVSREQVTKIKEQLEAAGATVQLKPSTILRDIVPGISAAMPVTAGKQVEGQKEFDVILATVGDKKINVIKEVRAITELGLKEAKDLVEGAPQPLKERVSKREAEMIRERLEGAGAIIEVKPSTKPRFWPWARRDR